MEPILAWGLDLIVAIQQFRGPVLDALFRAVSSMGDEEFYLLLFPIFLWCADFGLGARLGILALLSSYLNFALKDLFQQPRPYHVLPSVGLTTAEGYGLPSNHAQSAVVIWGALAAWVRRRWFWALAVACSLILLCEPLVGCSPRLSPSWQPASDGIKRQSDVVLVSISPHDPQTLFMATYERGGLYASSDGGTSWQTASEGLEGVTVFSLAPHPVDDRTLLVGTVYGAYKSTDGGKTWVPVPTLRTACLYALAWAPDGSAVYAGTEAHGIYASTDDGVSWTAIGPEGVSVLSLAVAPPRTIYAGSSGGGMWQSDDGGAHWQRTAEELDGAFVPNLHVASSGTVWALSDGFLYASDNGGQTWREAGPDGFQGRSMAVDPQGGEVIYIGGRTAGIAISADGGDTWEMVKTSLPATDFTRLAVHHHDPLTAYYAGTLHGVYKSIDSGESWTLVSEEAGELYVQALSVDPEEGDTIYAGTDSGIYVSRDGGESWAWASEDLGGITVFSLTIDPHNPGTVYAGTWGNNVLRSLDGGRSWAPIHHGLETLSVYSFAVSPADPRTLYAGTVEAIYKSADGGESWRPLEGLREDITTFALLLDPIDPSVIYAGTTDGVYRSSDGGETWTPIREGLGEVTVTTLAQDPDTGTLYAGTEHRGLFRYEGAGEHWILWGFQDRSVYAMIIEKGTGGQWVGTEDGVFRWKP